MSAFHDGIVHTVAEKCRRCYACVRNCPARAIKIQEGRAQVIKERCVCCGTCIRVCSQKAKYVRSDTGVVWQLLNNKLPVIAILSSSFPAAFPDVSAGQLVTALKKLGFASVMEEAFGAELVAQAYRDLISRDTNRQSILTHCPAVVDFIEKFYPQLSSLIAPVVSPTIAMGRAIKKRYDPGAKMVFIGPCIAKKIERESDASGNLIDAVLTFVECKEMLAFKDIAPSIEEETEFSGPKPNWARMHSLSGGLLKTAGVVPDMVKNDVVIAEGREEVLEILSELAGGGVSTRFLKFLFCKGCINGPMLGNELSFFRKQELITQYTLKCSEPARTEQDITLYADVDLSRSFTPSPMVLSSPSESDLHRILTGMNKEQREDELNCGACGYETCRELASAIFQGLAEKEMCWPYLMETLEASERQLTEAESRRFYLDHISAALEEERKHIACELHDSVAQTLIAVLHKLESFLQDKTHFEKGDTSSLWKLYEEIRSALHEVRQLSQNLRPAILDDLGLVAALAWLARQYKTRGIDTQFHVTGAERRLPPNTGLALFRIAQEALRNISRHSSASLAEVTVQFESSKVALSVRDNGTGFHVPADLAELAQLGKLGLIGMQERVRLLQGTINIVSEMGRGTTVTAQVPL